MQMQKAMASGSGCIDSACIGPQNRRSTPNPLHPVPALTLEACLPTIEEAVRYVARRYRLDSTEAADLRSEVHLRLLERDGLATFQHRCSLRTYLVTTVHNALLDLRNKAWQKWRPSMEARRLGPVALRLEELLVRDGYEFAQASEVLRTNHGVSESDSALAALRERLPARSRRRWVGEEAIETLPGRAAADMVVLETEQRYEATRLGGALEQALAGLEAEDRLVLKMRFYDGLKVSEIARLLGLDQKGLYRRLERLLGQLRATLTAAGFADSELVEALGESPVEIPPVFETQEVAPATRPAP
jgi:RNA polymerase sigma factor (sigma-70 family)